MTVESATWFAGQLVAGGVAALAGRRIARARPAVWKAAAVASTALMLLWPLIRVFPAHALALVTGRLLIFVEVTGIVLPAALLFTIAARHVRRPRDARAIYLLLVVCLLYFVRHGLWMIAPPPPDVPMSRYVDGVCRQSTDYTCVAASLVTLLQFHGVESMESEMARLSYTEVGGGTTDCRAVYALQRKLAGLPFEVRYEVMDYERLREIELPCVVPIKWGYFISHMVPVLSVNEERVRVGDPLTGAREISKEEFLREWLKRGVYLRTPIPE